MAEEHVALVRRLHRAVARQWVPRTWYAALERAMPSHYRSRRHLECYNLCVELINRGRLGEPTEDGQTLLELAGITFPRNGEQADALARDLWAALEMAVGLLFDERCTCWDLPIPPPSHPRCAECREPVWPGARYCHDCGNRIETPRRQLANECPRCGAQPIAEGDWFCFRCGFDLADPDDAQGGDDEDEDWAEEWDDE